MKGHQLLRFGGMCGILLGLFNAYSALIYILTPAAQQLGSPGAKLLPSVAQNPTMLILLHLGFALVGIFGLGLVPALSELALTPNNEGWVRWTSTLASFGYAVSAVSALLTIDRLPRVAQAFVAGDASTQAALLPTWRSSLDPFGMWSYGVVGLWILAVSIAGLSGTAQASTSRGMSLLGILVGILHLLIPLAFAIKTPFLFPIIDGIALFATTAWYLWVGVGLRSASTSRAVRSPATT